MDNTTKPRRRFLVFLLIAVPVLFFIGWSQASLNLSFIRPREPAQTVLLFALSTFVFLTFVIFSLLLSRNLLKLYLERRREQLGSKFKTKMVAAFLGLSVLPVIVLFLCAYGLMNRSLDKWFLIPFGAVRRDAEVLQEELQRVTQRETRRAAERLASEPRLIEAVVEKRSSDLQLLMRVAVVEFGLDHAACYSPRGEVLAKAQADDPSVRKLFAPFSPQEIAELAEAGTAVRRSSEGLRIFFSASRILGRNGQEVGTLVVSQSWPLEVEQAGIEITREVQNYDDLNQQHKFFRRVYLSVLSLLTLLILFAATWFALFLSKQVTVPIQALAEATGEISRGNLAFQVQAKADDELGELIHSFNAMTTQLGENRQIIERSTTELRQANQELEEQARYLETILLNIPAGVVSVDHGGRVREVNNNLERMLGPERARQAKDLNTLFGREKTREITALLRRAGRQGVATRQMELEVKGEMVHVALTVSAIGPNRGNLGYVLVMEDLTELVRVQKSAAWREVAQRIAHEIKNPLTPIQLSAERIGRLLERTRGGKITRQTVESLADCGTLISQEVGTLKSLVDEFSQFARLPTARPVPSDLNAVIENALSVFTGRLKGIRIHMNLSPRLPAVCVDPDQIKRALINLVDNAAEALESSLVKEIWVHTALDAERETIEIIVADSGPGVSPPVKEKLFLPYFSTKQHGTGLGLAIVSRIVSEHSGSIRVEENKPTGAKFIVELPLEATGFAEVAQETPSRETVTG